MSYTSSPGDAALGVGALISESIGLTFRNLFSLLIVWAIPFLLFALIAALLGGAFFASLQSQLDPGFGADPFSGAGMMAMGGGMLVFMILYMLLYGFGIAGTVQLAYDARAGRKARLGTAISTGFRRMMPVAIVSLVIGVALQIVIQILTWVVMGTLGASLDGAGAAVAAVLFIALYVGMFYVYATLMPMVPSLVVENAWFAAIGRSVSLTQGYRWPIVGFFLLMIVMILLFAALLLGAIFLFSQIGAVGAVLAGLLGAVAMIAALSFTGVASALVYGRLREIKEGTTSDTLADIFA